MEEDAFMGWQVKELIYRLHLKALDVRNCHRFAESATFGRAWEGASHSQREELCKLLLAGEKAKAMILVAKILSDSLADLPVEELRLRAQFKGIPYYSRMTKSQLLAALEKVNGRTSAASSPGDAAAPRASQDQEFLESA